jgi:signal transduction histidine kinase
VIYSHDVTRQIVAEEKAKRLALELAHIEEDERRRISQDLHDDVGQRMTALILQLKSIDRDLAAGGVNVHDQVKDAIRTVEAIVRQVRRVFYQLHPPSLDTVPLPYALEGFCQTFAQQTGLNVDFSSEERLPFVPGQHATALYRLVQEALNNVVKHSNATSAWISLDFSEGEISLSIEDNGEGFDPHRPVRGMGLSGVRDRFSVLDGTLEIESAPGKGTRLLGSLPLIAQAGD